MYFYPFDPTFVLLIPALLLAIWAQIKVKSAYVQYSEVMTRSGLTGAEVARLILRNAGIADLGGKDSCPIEPIGGELTDHYDPRTRVLRLSEPVYYGRSIAAVGIAAHEAGHALQHAQSYAPLMLRNVMYPVSSFGSFLAWPLFFIGLIFSSPLLLKAGIILFSLAVLFTVVTLPVEFNASNRALHALATGGFLDSEEIRATRKVLSAAALTYVAAAAMAILQLLRMFLLARSRD